MKSQTENKAVTIQNLYNTIEYQEAKIECLKHCLSRIIQDLPRNKDWLDPSIEDMAKDLIKNQTSAVN